MQDPTNSYTSSLLLGSNTKPRIFQFEWKTPKGELYDPSKTKEQTGFHSVPLAKGKDGKYIPSCIAAIGGQRAGKTTAAILELLKYATTAEFLPTETDPRPLKILICRKTFGDLEKITWPHLLSLVPKQLIINETSSPAKMELHLSTGAIFVGMNLQDVNRLGGFEAGAFLIDEVQDIGAKEDVQLFHHLRSRLSFDRGPNRGIISGYPYANENWYWHLFLNREAAHPLYTGFIFMMDDNAALPVGFKRSLREGYTPEEAARWLDGCFNTFEDRIFPMFKRDIHVIPHLPIPDSWLIYAAIDPGWDHPAAILIFAVDDTGRIHVIDEIYAKKTPIEELCAQFAERLGDRKPELVVFDPHDNKTIQQREGQPIKTVDIWREHLQAVGIANVVVGKRAFTRDNITLIREYLGKTGGSPRLLVHSHCKNTVYEFERWRNNNRGEPEGTGDDAISCVYNLLQMRPRNAPTLITVEKKNPRLMIIRDDEDDDETPSYLHDITGNQYAATTSRVV